MSKDKKNESNKQIQMNQQGLQKSMIQLKQLVKSLRLSFPKQARRSQSICSILKNPILISYISNGNYKKQQQQNLSNFTQYTEYKELLCSQSLNKFEQIYHELQRLSLDFKKAFSNSKIKKETININDFVKKFNQIKSKFIQIWKQQYFMILNYKMDNTAKDLQRWSCLTFHKYNKQKTTLQINNLFI